MYTYIHICTHIYSTYNLQIINIYNTYTYIIHIIFRLFSKRVFSPLFLFEKPDFQPNKKKLKQERVIHIYHKLEIAM